MMYSAAQSACRKVASASVSDKAFHKHLYLPFVAQSQHLQTHLWSKIPLSYLKELFHMLVSPLYNTMLTTTDVVSGIAWHYGDNDLLIWSLHVRT